MGLYRGCNFDILPGLWEALRPKPFSASGNVTGYRGRKGGEACSEEQRQRFWGFVGLGFMGLGFRRSRSLGFGVRI